MLAGVVAAGRRRPPAGITYIGSAAGGTTATIPAHQAGDIILGFGFRDGSTSPPTVPAGWTTLQTNNVNTGGAVAFKVAAGSSETSGSWTSANTLLVMVYRGPSGVGASAMANGLGSVLGVDYPALTLASGSSWVVAFAGHRNVDTALETPPAGTVLRIDHVTAACECVSFDTNSAASAWTAKTVTVGGSSGRWCSASIELLA
jgi:hypothetical protein